MFIWTMANILQQKKEKKSCNCFSEKIQIIYSLDKLTSTSTKSTGTLRYIFESVLLKDHYGLHLIQFKKKARCLTDCYIILCKHVNYRREDQ